MADTSTTFTFNAGAIFDALAVQVVTASLVAAQVTTDSITTEAGSGTLAVLGSVTASGNITASGTLTASTLSVTSDLTATTATFTTITTASVVSSGGAAIAGAITGDSIVADTASFTSIAGGTATFTGAIMGGSIGVNSVNTGSLVADGGTITVVGGLSGSTLNLSGALALSQAGVAGSSVQRFSGTLLTGGTGTTTLPQVLQQATGTTAPATWSTAGTYNGINAPAGFAGNFFDCKANGVTAFLIRADGSFVSKSITSAATGGVTIGADNTTTSFFSAAAPTAQVGDSAGRGVTVRATGGYGFASGGEATHGIRDTGIHRNGVSGEVKINKGDFANTSLGSLSIAFLRLEPTPVGSLPSASLSSGQIRLINDALTAASGTAPVGGGTNWKLVIGTGSAWITL